MTIEITPPHSTAHVEGRTAPIPANPDSDTRQAHNVGLRHRYFLQLADVFTLTASAYIGAICLSHLSAQRAGALGYRDVILTAVAMAVALHLHGLYRRPASRLRPRDIVKTCG